MQITAWTSVPVGNYKGFKFTVGLDSATNHKDPTLYSASNPLIITKSIYSLELELRLYFYENRR
jgi:hypothetical protein